MPTILEAHIEADNILSGYFLIGGADGARQITGRVLNVVFKNGWSIGADYHEFLADKFGIDEAREVKRISGSRPPQGAQVFLLNANGITMEAANALLKITEEPPVGTYFFIFSAREEKLPTTLRSRFVKIFLRDVVEQEEAAIRAEKFAGQTMKSRLDEVKKMAEDNGRQRADIFFSDYEAYLEKMLKQNKDGIILTGCVNEVERFWRLRKLFESPASFSKAVLEQLVINMFK
jgi:hypothetical protein